MQTNNIPSDVIKKNKATVCANIILINNSNINTFDKSYLFQLKLENCI